MWFLEELSKFQGLVQHNRPPAQQPIKVAILDSGIDRNDVVVKRFIEKKGDESTFIEKNCVAFPNTLHPLEDGNGHGTRCAALLLRTAPDIELFVVRIINDDGKMELGDDDYDYDCIVEAISSLFAVLTFAVGS